MKKETSLSGKGPSRDEKKRRSRYTVQAGDTLGTLAERFDLDVATLMTANEIVDPSRLQVGQTLLVPPEKGAYHRVRSGDTLWEVALEHDLAVDTVLAANPGLDPGVLPLKTLLFLPGGKPEPTATVAARRQRLVWPVRGTITSRYGSRTHPVTGRRSFHNGIDIAVNWGTPVKAAASGRVVYAGWLGAGGLTVKIDHENGMITRYSHNGRLAVRVGESVSAGEVIAYSGSSGRSTGPHLEFAVTVQGSGKDPLGLLP